MATQWRIRTLNSKYPTSPCSLQHYSQEPRERAQSKCPLMGAHKMEYDSAVKKETLLFVMTEVGLEGLCLSETSQKKTRQGSDLIYLWHLKSTSAHRYRQKTGQRGGAGESVRRVLTNLQLQIRLGVKWTVQQPELIILCCIFGEDCWKNRSSKKYFVTVLSGLLG